MTSVYANAGVDKIRPSVARATNLKSMDKSLLVIGGLAI
jgi:hypothetical protein